MQKFTDTRINAKTETGIPVLTDKYPIPTGEDPNKYNSASKMNTFNSKINQNTADVKDLMLLGNELVNEAIEFGLSIEDFKALIILRYETAEATYQQFLFMIERCRTFIQTLIENNDFTKVDSAFALIDTLDAPEQAQSLMASILEL